VAKDVFRHAIDAAEIAAIGHRDAEVMHRPAPGVGHDARHRRRRSGATDEVVQRPGAGSGAKIGDRNDRGHGKWQREQEMVADGGPCPGRNVVLVYDSFA